MWPGDPVSIFETFTKVAARICPDQDVAHDLAMEAFEEYCSVRNPRGNGSNLRAYAWKVLAARYRRHLSEQWSHITDSRMDEDGRGIESLLPPSRGGQEDYVHARQWLPFIDELPEPCRAAIRILGDGGTVTDVMADLRLDPKGALYAIAEGRRLLRLRVT